MISAASDILDFWFGDAADDAEIAERQSGVWWEKNRATDDEIRNRFGELPDRALRGELAGWLEEPRGRLAAIIVTDQFPRNIYRGRAQSFSYDSVARRFCLEGIRARADRELRPIERAFFYLPLEHSEQIDDQDLAVLLFRRILTEAPAALQERFQGYVGFAEQHRDIIARFGRFPHRNELLGRVSTPEELAFLEEPGSSF